MMPADPSETETNFYDFGVDVMANNILRYLEPIETYTFVTSPLSKEFQLTYNLSRDLWKVLCISEPFYAKVHADDDDEEEGQDYSTTSTTSRDNNSSIAGSYPGPSSKNIIPCTSGIGVKQRLGDDYRLLYSSMIKCTIYLNRVKEDIINGRTPSGAYDCDGIWIGSGIRSACGSKSNSANSGKNYHEDNNSVLSLFAKMLKMKKSDSLGEYVQIKPSSGAIYSIANWMVTLADVVGIQIMCLKVLPDLLVDEQQRASAHQYKYEYDAGAGQGHGQGLTDIVVRAMVIFPDVVELHTAAFHTLALLARPLGGKEGMMLNQHSAKVNINMNANASGLFNVGSNSTTSTNNFEKSIEIMLDSMKRFVGNADLMAMSCWSMVNIALIPSQKVLLVRLGGIAAAVHAMLHHPQNAEVQFRALFALINLVIPLPSENRVENLDSFEAVAIEVAGTMEDHQGTDMKMLDDSIAQVTNLTVVAMQNFSFSERILSKACLVLHNLSLNKSNHRVLLLTPNCYPMLQWCIGKYKSESDEEVLLERGARDTLTRLQMTLSGDPALRVQFTAALRLREKWQYDNKIGEHIVSPEVLQRDVPAHNKSTLLP